MRVLGFHYRLTDIQASLASSQLQKLDKFMERRQELIRNYKIHFEQCPNLKTAQSIDHSKSANHLLPILIDFKALNFSRNELMRSLRKFNIFTQVHYIPVTMHPYYVKVGHHSELFPNSIDYYERTLSIPLYYGLTDTDQKNFLKILHRNIAYLSQKTDS
jgi:dTDP-4-amino-4,6-dideoxygalactose transaminase